MANPEVKRTIINVKGVDQEQWERAKTAANRADETMGEWLSRAVKLLADAEEGGRVFAPNGANPEVKPMTPEQVAGLMNATVALSAAQGRPVPVRSAAALRAVVEDLARAARGLPPREVVKRVANRPVLLGNPS